eukprot:TRINITY_DN986_c0_g2_i1.p1 TRINITY_DN986_c0_g2~~TRINITY_DN986_c0_g2_i1.p1  ORF type:complete len:766 (+),score=93.91 TRINITY_DN986_c0_g2_i1:90-2387(+)
MEWSQQTLSYLQFHFVFTIPAFLFVSAALYLSKRWNQTRLVSLAILLVVVYASATPWDRFLIHNGVWSYSEQTVVGTYMDIPLEEYLFFGIQTLTTGFTYFVVMAPQVVADIQKAEVARPGGYKAGWKANLVGAVGVIGTAGALLAVPGAHWFYVKSILVYFLAFITIQVLMGMRQLCGPLARGRLLAAVALPTVFYWLADATAIHSGTWAIAPATSLNIYFGSLPLEEALFFVVTNLLIVQGLFLVEVNYDLMFGKYKWSEKHKIVHSLTKNRRVAVIGAGIGGLAVAGRLAKMGFDVTVYEKKDHVGGRLDVIRKKGYRFDVGPSIMLMPDVFAQSYSDLGRSMKDYMNLVKCNPIYGVHFEDGETLILSNDMAQMKVTLEGIEAGSFGRFLDFLSEGHFHYNWSVDHIVGRNFRHILEYFNPLKIPLLFKMRAFTNFYQYISTFFKSEKIRQALSFQNMYLGISPYKAMATYSLLQYTEYCDGVWYPKGGMYQISETMYAICKELGVKFEFHKEVAKMHTDTRVKSVSFTDGSSVDNLDLVVCNADLPFVYKHLLPPSAENNRIENMKYTSSTIMFYWGMDKVYPQIKHHNIFLCGDYKESFDQIFEDSGIILPDRPSFYVNAPQRSDPSVAPEGCDSLMVLVPVGHMKENFETFNWEQLRLKAKRYVLDRLHKLVGEDIEPHITVETSYTPYDWYKNYNLEKGATFGLSHNFMQVGYLRPHNKHASLSNLYFVGASTHPGSGVPLVLLSAKLTAEHVFEDL